MLGLLLMAAQAVATAPAPIPCKIISEKQAEESLLFGVCGKRAVRLGVATRYETMAHVGTGVAVAMIEKDGEQRVLVVRPGADGRAFLEDVTGDLAKKGGRSAQAGLAGLAIDLSRFADEGLIAVAATDKGGEARASASARLSIVAMIADEALRQALPPEESRVVDVVAEDKGSEAQ
ncbi:hypothetical protein MOK15_15480 [Sphingobium sp. BYY-5]|uniref:hypothetical protein n=1 Tax=Sphingobium sp. BYY-5 TaxID=2926400 RepID=UPI001FA77F80|nr:hypothetical protein [Sphingobium sp. BYY-5]MCI4591483.1 hypothetical protein [Sphingobium sp. BYY-5]